MLGEVSPVLHVLSRCAADLSGHFTSNDCNLRTVRECGSAVDTSIEWLFGDGNSATACGAGRLWSAGGELGASGLLTSVGVAVPTSALASGDAALLLKSAVVRPTTVGGGAAHGQMRRVQARVVFASDAVVKNRAESCYLRARRDGSTRAASAPITLPTSGYVSVWARVASDYADVGTPLVVFGDSLVRLEVRSGVVELRIADALADVDSNTTEPSQPKAIVRVEMSQRQRSLMSSGGFVSMAFGWNTTHTCVFVDQLEHALSTCAATANATMPVGVSGAMSLFGNAQRDENQLSDSYDIDTFLMVSVVGIVGFFLIFVSTVQFDAQSHCSFSRMVSSI